MTATPRSNSQAQTGVLTHKQQRFCEEYLRNGGNASAAYRAAYNCREGTKPETIHRHAHDVLRNGKVAARLAEFQAIAAERAQLTIDDIVTELEEARQLAKDTSTPAAMVSASMGKAKLLGFVIDRKEVTVHGMIAAMTDAELAAFIDECDVDDEDYQEA